MDEKLRFHLKMQIEHYVSSLLKSVILDV